MSRRGPRGRLRANGTADAKIASVKADLDNFDTANSIAQQVVPVLLPFAKSAGAVMPSETQIFLAIKTIVDTGFSLAAPAPAAA